MAYNFAKRLKALKGKTPWQFILNTWTKHPEYFNIEPNHYFVGLVDPEILYTINIFSVK